MSTKIESTQPIAFDQFGRMRYHPDYHGNHRKPWRTDEIRFLVKHYDKVGAEECSLALERTPHTVMEKVSILRRQGVMKKPERQAKHKRQLYQHSPRALGDNQRYCIEQLKTHGCWNDEEKNVWDCKFPHVTRNTLQSLVKRGDVTKIGNSYSLNPKNIEDSKG